MKQFSKLAALTAAVALGASSVAFAKVSEDEAARLGQDLTPFGAETAGNADGTIPAWTGSVLGVPEGITYEGDGTANKSPYADEKPLFSITADNAGDYAERLSGGQKAMFKKYSKTFRIDVYPSHRDFALDPLILERTKWNATHTVMSNGGEAISNWTGSTAFPIPKDGMEVMWNARTGAITQQTQHGKSDVVGVFANGDIQLETQRLTTRFPFNNPNTKVGTTEKEIGTQLFNTLSQKLAPANVKGEMTLVVDPIDYTVGNRLVYSYVPGTRRVRQAPSVSFDTPTGPGGIVTTDDTDGYNGAFYKFDFKLLGKREMYLPFHNNSITQVPLDDLLTPNHVNPDHIRYELIRVWVVESTLKSGERHIYGKRVYYVAEDNWAITAVDNYDGRGELFRTSLFPSYYHYALNAYYRSTQMFHDLNTGQYNASRLTNNHAGPTKVVDTAKKDKFYTPSNLRRMGRR